MNTTPAPRVYVLPHQRIVWVWIAKSGCTSILHMLSQVNGRRPGAPDASAIPEWSPELVIHDYRVHGLRRLEQASARVRQAATVDAGWWRFAIVRAPHARFLSAWLDKVFLRAPGTPHLWEAAEDVLTAEGRIDVTATFNRFVEEFARSPARFFADRHFTPQHTSLAQGVFADLEIIPLSQFARVPARLASHTGRVCEARRFNESLDIEPGRVYDPTTVAVVSDCYRHDLELDPAVPVPAPAAGDHLVLTRLETDCVHKLRAASLRIRQLARLAILPGLTVRLQRLLGRR
jgi:hypothetical protein